LGVPGRDALGAGPDGGAGAAGVEACAFPGGGV
jgi:hypothetical protein